MANVTAKSILLKNLKNVTLSPLGSINLSTKMKTYSDITV